MWSGIVQAAGGVGLFLLGMSVMTGGLKALADERLRTALTHATRGPISGVCTGAAATALLRSSSATTVAAVGFVHAGLLTFPQALTIIFGANIGTTTTGWIVALLGFKMDLGNAVLPLIFVGALMRLAGRRRVEAAGTALAGFGLIFVGIDVLQSGMAAFHGVVTPESFPPDTIVGRLLSVLIGVAITVVTQSSSAGVAAALAAVNAGTISLNQAAAMVIGMDFGTTITAAMATIGGNVQARRTGMAHVVYNAITACGAFLLLTPFFMAVDAVLPTAAGSNPELVLVGFHTTFNTLGVIAVVPFTRNFAALIVRLFPERGNPLTRRLDSSLLNSPPIALDLAAQTLESISRTVFREVATRIAGSGGSEPQVLTDARDALDQTREYLQRISVESTDTELLDKYLRNVHVLDHLRRSVIRAGRESRLKLIRADGELSSMTDELLRAIELLLPSEGPLPSENLERIREINSHLKSRMREYRRGAMILAAAGTLDSQTALRRMDTARWLRRLAHHVMRLAEYSTSVPEVLAADSSTLVAEDAGPETNRGDVGLGFRSDGSPSDR